MGSWIDRVTSFSFASPPSRTFVYFLNSILVLRFPSHLPTLNVPAVLAPTSFALLSSSFATSRSHLHVTIQLLHSDCQ